MVREEPRELRLPVSKCCWQCCNSNLAMGQQTGVGTNPERPHHAKALREASVLPLLSFIYADLNYPNFYQKRIQNVSGREYFQGSHSLLTKIEHKQMWVHKYNQEHRVANHQEWVWGQTLNHWLDLQRNFEDEMSENPQSLCRITMYKIITEMWGTVWGSD